MKLVSVLLLACLAGAATAKPKVINDGSAPAPIPSTSNTPAFGFTIVIPKETVATFTDADKARLCDGTRNAYGQVDVAGLRDIASGYNPDNNSINNLYNVNYIQCKIESVTATGANSVSVGGYVFYQSYPGSNLQSAYAARDNAVRVLEVDTDATAFNQGAYLNALFPMAAWSTSCDPSWTPVNNVAVSGVLNAPGSGSLCQIAKMSFGAGSPGYAGSYFEKLAAAPFSISDTKSTENTIGLDNGKTCPGEVIPATGYAKSYEIGKAGLLALVDPENWNPETNPIPSTGDATEALFRCSILDEYAGLCGISVGGNYASNFNINPNQTFYLTIDQKSTLGFQFYDNADNLINLQDLKTELELDGSTAAGWALGNLTACEKYLNEEYIPGLFDTVFTNLELLIPGTPNGKGIYLIPTDIAFFNDNYRAAKMKSCENFVNIVEEGATQDYPFIDVTGGLNFVIHGTDWDPACDSDVDFYLANSDSGFGIDTDNSIGFACPTCFKKSNSLERTYFSYNSGAAGKYCRSDDDKWSPYGISGIVGTPVSAAESVRTGASCIQIGVANYGSGDIRTGKPMLLEGSTQLTDGTLTPEDVFPPAPRGVFSTSAVVDYASGKFKTVALDTQFVVPCSTPRLSKVPADNVEALAGDSSGSGTCNTKSAFFNNDKPEDFWWYNLLINTVNGNIVYPSPPPSNNTSPSPAPAPTPAPTPSPAPATTCTYSDRYQIQSVACAGKYLAFSLNKDDNIVYLRSTSQSTPPRTYWTLDATAIVGETPAGKPILAEKASGSRQLAHPDAGPKLGGSSWKYKIVPDATTADCNVVRLAGNGRPAASKFLGVNDSCTGFSWSAQSTNPGQTFKLNKA